MAVKHIPGAERIGSDDIFGGGVQSPSAKLPPAVKLKLADLLSGASLETIKNLLKHCEAEAKKHTCSGREMKEDRPKSACMEGWMCAHGEMAEEIDRDGVSFGLDSEMQKGLYGYFKSRSGDELEKGAHPEDSDFPVEYYKKGMERAYRHFIYQIEKIHSLELEKMKKVARPTKPEFNGIHDLF